jgi:hypothetical protein
MVRELVLDGVGVILVLTALVMLVVVVELASAVLPLIIVIAFVPPEDRHELAEVLAAADRSRKLRIWPALRAAVEARRSLGSRWAVKTEPNEGVQIGRCNGPACRRPG